MGFLKHLTISGDVLEAIFESLQFAELEIEMLTLALSAVTHVALRGDYAFYVIAVETLAVHLPSIRVIVAVLNLTPLRECFVQNIKSCRTARCLRTGATRRFIGEHGEILFEFGLADYSPLQCLEKLMAPPMPPNKNRKTSLFNRSLLFPRLLNRPAICPCS